MTTDGVDDELAGFLQFLQSSAQVLYGILSRPLALFKELEKGVLEVAQAGKPGLQHNSSRSCKAR